MAQDGYPADPRAWKSYKDVEERAVVGAHATVFTTPGAARTYRERYPAAASRIAVVENGYDDESFADLPAGVGTQREPLCPGVVTLLHSGIVYPSERDPAALFAALRQLQDRGEIRPGRLKIRFRAAEHETMLRDLAERHDIVPLIEVVPPIPYRDALDEMVRADALLVLQASNCNEQIPAKVYEYLRACRPIIGLTDERGDTAGVLRAAGIDSIAPLDSVDAIATLLRRFLGEIDVGCAALPDPEYVARTSRRQRTRELAAILDEAVTN
jgi:hypothetical protein